MASHIVWAPALERHARVVLEWLCNDMEPLENRRLCRLIPLLARLQMPAPLGARRGTSLRTQIIPCRRQIALEKRAWGRSIACCEQTARGLEWRLPETVRPEPVGRPSGMLLSIQLDSPGKPDREPDGS